MYTLASERRWHGYYVEVMMMPSKRYCVLFALSLMTLLSWKDAVAKPDPPPDHWVGTWATADLSRTNTAGTLGAATMTLRQTVHVSLGGALVRVELSNRFGTEPLTLSAVHIALPDAGAGKGDIQLASAHALTFSGRPMVVIPAGAMVVSDPAAMDVKAMSDLVISMTVPAQALTHLTVHNSAYATQYVAAGDVTGQKSLPAGTTTMDSWFFLKSVDVRTAFDTASVVAFGDSITDGTFSTPDKNNRWPDVLARRLQGNKKTRGLGVLNVGIGGNRVLHDGAGPNALARFDDDVLAQAGVRYLILLESINDIGQAYKADRPIDLVTAEDLEAGLQQMVERAHVHGIKVFGGTLTPYLGAGYASAAGEEVRKAVNAWIRTSRVFDGVIDFEAATMDAGTGAFKAAYDHGDHLHPTDAGMDAMAGAVDLKLFELDKKEKADIRREP